MSTVNHLAQARVELSGESRRIFIALVYGLGHKPADLVHDESTVAHLRRIAEIAAVAARGVDDDEEVGE